MARNVAIRESYTSALVPFLESHIHHGLSQVVGPNYLVRE